MAFQIKNFTSIVAGAINHMRGTQKAVTDFNIGSVARTLVEAAAIEMDETYQQMFNGLREAIPVATFNSFNFDRLPARVATGVVRVVISSAPTSTTIAAGTLFTGDNSAATYRSSNDVVMIAGVTTADILVAAVVPGASGNLLSGETFSLGPTPSGFVSATNITAFSGGADEETDDQRKERFVAYVTTLQRATTAALEYGAKLAVRVNADGAEVERVRTVAVIEPYVSDPFQPVAWVKVFVHNGTGETSDALVAEVARVLHGFTDEFGTKVAGWKAAGVKVDVLKAIETDLNLVAVVTPKAGFDEAAVLAAVQSALSEYIRTIDIGGTFQVAQAIFIAKSLDGVANIVFSSPTVDQASDEDEKLVAGSITLTAP